MNRPYSLNLARLASGAFYEIIVLVSSYEIITICCREIVFGWGEHTKMDAGCQEEKAIFS
jgi:hypothetical protein